ncbi:MAG: hypothetical protein J5J06_15705 [Phycisphaerae bacterium]|nr:hypothetical protein [Phycisphaerae bacterium]
MNSSESGQCEADTMIARIAALLDESLLAQLIDRPINNAVESFSCGVETPESHLQAHDLVTDFVIHMHAQTASLRGRFSRERMKDVAVALLEQGYSGFRSAAYDEALRDAFDESQDGMRIIIARLAEAAKRRRRQEYTRWVFARHIDPLDWETRCLIAKLLLARATPLLPPPPKGYTYRPEELVDNIPDLMERLLETERQARQTLSDPLAALA